MRVLRGNIKLRPVGSNHDIILKNDFLLGDGERLRDAMERLYKPEHFNIISFDFHELNPFMGKQVFDLGQIDFYQLSKQKNSLIEMVNKVGTNDIEGILSLLDHIQDYAVDKLGYPQKEVYPDLEKEAEEFGEAMKGMEEDEFRAWVKENQPIEESDAFYDNAPPHIKAIFNSFDDNQELYSECRRVSDLLENEGYLAEYGLDGQSLFDFRIKE